MKFSDDSELDKESPFVRQNTPHPKELKAKAHRILSKEKIKLDDGNDLDTLDEEVRICYYNVICLLLHSRDALESDSKYWNLKSLQKLIKKTFI